MQPIPSWVNYPHIPIYSSIPMEFLSTTFPGQADVIRYLIEHGANVNAETVFKETALHWSAHSGKS